MKKNTRNAIKQSRNRSKKKKDAVIQAQRLIVYFNEGEKTVSDIARIAKCSRNTAKKHMVDWSNI